MDQNVVILGQKPSFLELASRAASAKHGSELKVDSFERAHFRGVQSTILEKATCVHFEICRLEHVKMADFGPAV